MYFVVRHSTQTNLTPMQTLKLINKTYSIFMENGNNECAIITSVNFLLFCDDVYHELEKLSQSTLLCCTPS